MHADAGRTLNARAGEKEKDFSLEYLRALRGLRVKICLSF